MEAQPSILVVEPNGTAKDAYSLGTPSRSVTFWVSGMVPTEERETNASWIAGQAPLKNWSGLTLATVPSSSG
ncbi:hypothetical protein STAL104432_09975 [Streptomyces albus]